MLPPVLGIPGELVPDESLPVGFQNIGTGGDFYERFRGLGEERRRRRAARPDERDARGSH